MEVYKFGGASIRNAQAVQNMARILQATRGRPLLVVVSAMGKTTNALEKLLQIQFSSGDTASLLDELHKYHKTICKALFNDQEHQIHKKLENLISKLRAEMAELTRQSHDFHKIYDQLVCYGELLSSTIVSQYLEQTGLACQMVDARELIRTDHSYTNAQVNWPLTEKQIRKTLLPILKKKVVITQGFIGGDNTGHTTTLGREGSDFSAAIFGSSLNAREVTIWKDVEGILNADPKLASDTEKYDQLSYQEAAEMAYYGAKVIHPKTIRPLANKQIPLIVRSFANPDLEGTVIDQNHPEKLAPCIIFKFNQSLISFKVRDFDFINEEHLNLIFHRVHLLGIRVNIMQNSAISLSLCVDSDPDKTQSLMSGLQEDFEILYNDELELITVKNYNPESLDKISEGKEILLEQRTRTNFQLVIASHPDH